MEPHEPITWVEAELERRIPPSAQLALVRAALDKRPGDPRLTGRLGVFLEKMGRLREASEAFEASRTADPEAFVEWPELVRVLVRLGEGTAALETCERGMAIRPSLGLALTYGNILVRRKRRAEALRAFESAITYPGRHASALSRLLQILAADSPMLCLDRIDALAPEHRYTSPARAWRAVALSKLGQRDAAMTIIDPGEHVMRIPFEPPAGFGGIEAFNRMLAAEILADPPEIPFNDETLVNDRPRRADKPALQAFHAFGRRALAEFAVDHKHRGIIDSPPPSVATLGAITTVLYRDGTNLQHIHETSYVSAVYHVRVPEAVRQSDGRAGALEFGGCEKMVDGYEPCWGKAYHKPVEGWLTLFPSHMFHDVVETGAAEPRISTAVEMVPVRA